MGLVISSTDTDRGGGGGGGDHCIGHIGIDLNPNPARSATVMLKTSNSPK